LVGDLVRWSVSLTTDSDADLRVTRRRAELRHVPWAILGAISAGGVLGAEGRYGLSVLWPHSPGRFPWTTFSTNVTGCFLIGVLMVVITEVWSARRLLRPFLGVGVLGGYTTFSTYVLEVQQLIMAGEPRTALLYLAGTMLAALAAAYVGMFTTRLAVASKAWRREQR
jgi:fluoride exporter